MKKRAHPRPAPARPVPRHAGRESILWLAAILLVTFLAYVPSLDNDFTNWDDTQYVTENRLLPRADLGAIVTTPVGGNYHPLTILSLALNYRISGVRPASYHWLSLLLHLANTALVFAFVWMLSGGRRWTSIASSLFFGIHPTHVESVAWIAERKDVLYAFFYLAGMITYLRYLDARRAGWWAATFAAFALSAASKPAAVVFPVTLLLIDWYRKRAWSPFVLIEKIPWFAVSVATGLLTIHAQVASGALEHQWNLLTKVLSATYGLIMYPVKLFLPFHLSAIYPFPNIVGQQPGWEFYVAFAVAVVGIPTAFLLFRRQHHVVFGLAFFLLNIALVLQFVAVGKAVMADRYTYIPYIGLFFALAWPLDDRAGEHLKRFPARAVLAGGFLALGLVSVIQTWKRCDVWQNSETLWNDTIRKYPRRVVDAYVNRGYYYHHVARRYEDALADFDQALALNARVPNAWNDRGMLLADMGRPDSALVCFDRALELKPDFDAAWNNRGGTELMKGNLQQGIADVSRAIALSPQYRDAYANRAIGYSMLGDHEKSIADSRRVLELDLLHPGRYLFFGMMGASLEALNRHRDAIAAFDEAIRLAPSGEPRRGNYYLQRSQAWDAVGDRARALSDAREAERWGIRVDAAYLKRVGG